MIGPRRLWRTQQRCPAPPAVTILSPRQTKTFLAFSYCRPPQSDGSRPSENNHSRLKEMFIQPSVFWPTGYSVPSPCCGVETPRITLEAMLATYLENQSTGPRLIIQSSRDMRTVDMPHCACSSTGLDFEHLINQLEHICQGSDNRSYSELCLSDTSVQFLKKKGVYLANYQVLNTST